MAQLIATEGLSSENSDTEQLTNYLEENYNMPKDEWWPSVDNAFRQLRNVLERRPSETAQEDSDPETISTRTARAGALPIVSILPSGSHALQLTATNEDLPCVAFGSISTQLYVEIFWEAVAKVQDKGGRCVVYRVVERLGCFWFNFEGHNFQLLYVQCEELVRSYPEILNVSDSVLQEVDSHTRGVVEGINRSTKEMAYLNKHSRRAYHYLRAWAITGGLYTTDQSLTSGRTLRFQDLVKIMDPESLVSQDQNQEVSMLSVSRYISNIFKNLNEYLLSKSPFALPARPLDPESRPAELLKMLQGEELDSVHSKFGMMVYIQVKVAYWGGSDMTCGKWLSMVERRLSKLKERLETTDPRPIMVCAWPQRLVGLENDGSNTEGDFYEGCYILGIQYRTGAAEVSAITSVVQRWTVQVEGDDETTKEDCSIRALCMLAVEFEDVRLRPCTRKWPRPVVAVDREKNHRDERRNSQIDASEKSKRTSKHTKNEDLSNVELTTHESHRKLRPASDVLKRLKHDRTLNIDKFKVGYVDRHTDEIQEKPAMAWVRDTTDEEWIPEHRIVYFKRCSANGDEQMMWDKVSKVDRIFKDSGNNE